MSGGPPPERPQPDPLRGLVPALALVVAIAAAVADPASAADLVLVAIVVAAFGFWAYVPGVPLAALCLAVLAPVVLAQRSGQLEPLMFEVSLLAFVVARWARSVALAVALGLIAVAAPPLVGLVQDPSEVATGIWMMGIAFPWIMGYAAARQVQLSAELDVTRQELAEQALLAERRRIARDVHDLVAHGLAAVMLQVTGARHVLRRDPAGAEEALRSAEELGRRSMGELRQTVALLRSEDESAAEPPLPAARDVPALIEHARAGGLAVELETRGDLSAVAPSVGVAPYRIAQEAVANAARHAPRARTLVRIELADGRACLDAETAGPTHGGADAGRERPGYGLVGMRERAAALGGELAAGPTADGWRLSCRLPLEASDARPAAGGRR